MTAPTYSINTSKLFATITTTNATKITIESFIIKPFTFCAKTGKYARTSIPKMRGKPSIKKIVDNISTALMLKSRIISRVGPYKDAQNIVFSGVIIIANTVEIADMLIESGVFPFAKCVKKLDKFPPGQAATKNNPSAILGRGWIIMTIKYVKAGNNKN